MMVTFFSELFVEVYRCAWKLFGDFEIDTVVLRKNYKLEVQRNFSTNVFTGTLEKSAVLETIFSIFYCNDTIDI